MTALADLNLDDGTIVVLRQATAEDVPGIVRLLADDELGASRERINDDGELQPYLRAFRWAGHPPDHVGSRRSTTAGVCNGSTHHRQIAQRRARVLREIGLRGLP